MSFNLREALGRSIGLLSLLAQQTTTKVDDELVALMDAIYNSPKLMDWFATKFAESEKAGGVGVLSIEAGPPETLVEEIRLRDIDWAKMAQHASTIIAIVKLLSGK
jgi:hypothetical protein